MRVRSSCACVHLQHLDVFAWSCSLSVCLPACLRVCQRHAAPLGRQCPRSSDIGITSRFDLRRVFIVTCLLCLAPAGTVLCLPGKCLSVSYVVAVIFFLFCCCSVCGYLLFNGGGGIVFLYFVLLCVVIVFVRFAVVCGLWIFLPRFLDLLHPSVSCCFFLCCCS